MVRPKNETEDLLLSITKNCETLIKQTHTKQQKALEIKLTKPTETFSFKPSISIEVSWMIGLTNFEVYNSILNRTEQNINFKFYMFPESEEGEITYEKVRYEIENFLKISDITAANLQDETIGPTIIEE